MGPQGKVTARYSIPVEGEVVGRDMVGREVVGKERLLSSGSVSGSPGRLHDNVSRDSGVGGLKVGNASRLNIFLSIQRFFVCVKQELFSANSSVSYMKLSSFTT